MTIADRFSATPDSNNKSAPNGAPEGQFPLDKISDTFRLVMASLAEINTRINSLGGLTEQNANNVEITGGRIAAKTLYGGDFNVIAPSCLFGDYAFANAGGLTPAFRQTLYDMFCPVGSMRFWHRSDGAGLVFTGCVATWRIVPGSADALVVIAGTGYAGGTVRAGSANINGGINVAANGAHSHFGATQSTALTTNQIPAHDHSSGFYDQLLRYSGGADTSTSFGTTLGQVAIRTSAPISSVGGGQGHTHGITAEPNHTHFVDTAQLKAIGMYLWERTA